MRVTQDDSRAHVDQPIHEEQAALEHLLVDEDRARALGGQDERHGREVGGEARPGGVVDGGNGAAEVVGHRQPLAARHHERGALQLRLHAEAGEDEPDHAQVIGRHVEHAQLAARHGGQRDERADLDVVGPDPVGGGRERLHALDLEGVGPDAD